MQPFHLAIAVDDLNKADEFYSNILGCEKGRSAEKWIDFNFFGHQVSLHLKPEECGRAKTNNVDGDNVPVKHFGVVLEWGEWEKLKARLEKHKTPFIVEPHVRFQGKAGEQGTFFFLDPAGNALEFKTFRNIEQLFERTGSY